MSYCSLGLCAITGGSIGVAGLGVGKCVGIPLENFVLSSASGVLELGSPVL